MEKDLATIRVNHPTDEGDFMTINKSDFDPEKHTPWEGTESTPTTGGIEPSEITTEMFTKNGLLQLGEQLELEAKDMKGNKDELTKVVYDALASEMDSEGHDVEEGISFDELVEKAVEAGIIELED